MRELNRQDLHDLLLGAAIVGTGGGGSLEKGLALIDKAVDDGLIFKMAEINEIPDQALIGTPYGCGSISPLTAQQKEEMDKLERIETTAEVAAVRIIEKYFGEELYGVVATELGGMNTAVALEAAARLGKPIIDADPAGRSVPCLQHSTYYLKDVPIYPLSIANAFGDEMIITEAMSDERAEALTRAAAVASFNHVGVVDHPNRWSVLKDTLLKESLSMCLDIGRIAREAQEAGVCYAEAVAAKYEGRVLFTGVIEDAEWEDRAGFTFGSLNVAGQGAYEGHQLKIWYQNENLMSWLDGEVYVTTPDAINIVDNSNNMPLLNPYGEVGMPITVFALKAFDEWRTPKGIEVLGPRFFGYDMEYKKLEDWF